MNEEQSKSSNRGSGADTWIKLGLIVVAGAPAYFFATSVPLAFLGHLILSVGYFLVTRLFGDCENIGERIVLLVIWLVLLVVLLSKVDDLRMLSK